MKAVLLGHGLVQLSCHAACCVIATPQGLAIIAEHECVSKLLVLMYSSSGFRRQSVLHFICVKLRIASIHESKQFMCPQHHCLSYQYQYLKRNRKQYRP